MTDSTLPPLLNRLRERCRRELAVYLAPDLASAEIRAHHLRALRNTTQWSMMATAFNALLMYASLRPAEGSWALLAWVSTMLSLSVWGLVVWWRGRRHHRSTASVKAVWRATRNGSLLGALWGLLAWVWFPGASPEQQMLIGLVFSGSACAGAYLLSSVPTAALGYLGAMMVGGLAALAMAPQPGVRLAVPLVFVYTFVLVQIVRTTAANATARLQADREVRRQGQLVSLLLRDFEEHSSDLLWEIDRSGHLTNVSARLASTLDQPAPLLAQQRFVDWLQAHGAAAGAAETLPNAGATLAAALALDKPFRDMVLAVRLRSGVRWWSLTAKPLVTDDGRTSGWRGVISDVTNEHQARRRLDHMAHFDALTGLANRVRLRERLGQSLQPGALNGPHGALMCLDVDNFKTINDSLGHSVGDAVLQQVAARLKALMRRSDLVARMGGDEFAIVLDGLAHADEAAALAERILAAMRAPCDVGGQSVVVGLSIGIAMIPDHGRSLDEVMGNADLALYAVKHGGRGRFEFFAPTLGERSRRRLTLEQELRRSLAQGDFQLHWQPQVDIEGWRPLGAEALLRWPHPRLGTVSPAEFVPVAEECGLICELGAWVLRQACLEAARHLPGVGISVNVSPAQLAQAGFVAEVEAALAASGLPARRLELEVTESLFMDADAVALANLRGLKNLGVKIALDDFGTGYSSLAYLRRFPFDSLKIDRAFVRELTDRSDARAIVRTIIQLADTLGMSTIAEGVEEPAQLQVLHHAGCNAIQGYLAARPMPMDELVRLLAQWPQGRRPESSQPLPVTQMAPL